MPIALHDRHGGAVYAAARAHGAHPDTFLDFSSNANIFALPLTRALVEETPYPFLHYPDTAAAALAARIAKEEETDPDRILIGNGAAELIWLAMQALAPRKVLFLGPMFSEYVSACEALGIGYEIRTPNTEDFVPDTDDMAALWETDADLAVLCTPNNPAAVAYPNIEGLLHGLRAPRVLIDCCYRDFLYGSEDYERNSRGSYAARLRPGVALFTLHSFTKFYCCPGIRLGYLMGDKTQIARIAALRPSWTVSPYAQIMGGLFLDNREAYRQTLPALYSAEADMARELRRLDRVNAEGVHEGPGFILCRLAPRLRAEDVCRFLLKMRIIVRNCDTIPGMPPGYIRLQARPREDAEKLLSALQMM